MLNLLVNFSDRDKRIIMFLFFLFAFVILIIGTLFSGLVRLSKFLGKGLDAEVCELRDYKIINNPKEMIACVKYRERRRLYTSNRLMFYVAIVSLSVTFIVFHYFLNDDYGLAKKAIDNLWFRWIWPRGTFFGIKNFIIGWPTKVIYPHPTFDIGSLLTYLNVVVLFILLVSILKSILVYFGRLYRAYDKANAVFGLDLDK